MAGSEFTVSSGNLGTTAGGTKVAVFVKAGTSQRVIVKGWWAFFKGAVVTDEPVICQLIRLTSDGAGGSSATLNEIDADIATFRAAATKGTFSTEPTAGEILKEVNVHPQAGYEIQADKLAVMAGGGRIGVRYVMPSGQNPNILAGLRVEE